MTIVRAPESHARELLSRPDMLDAFLNDPMYPEVFIDKAWHAIHFGLTGTLWDGEGLAAFLLKGGIPVDGTCPPDWHQVFFPDDVVEIERIVSDLSEEAFRTAMQRDEARWRHGGAGRPFTEIGFIGYEAHHLTALKAFLRESLGNAILVVLG